LDLPWWIRTVTTSVGAAVTETVPAAMLTFASIGSEQAKSQVAMILSRVMDGAGWSDLLATGVAGDSLADTATRRPWAASWPRLLQGADGRVSEPGVDRKTVGRRLGLNTGLERIGQAQPSPGLCRRRPAATSGVLGRWSACCGTVVMTNSGFTGVQPDG
jgi:hypothetical protein